MTEFQPNIERLHNGQIVYFADPDNGAGNRSQDFTLIVKKGTIVDSDRNFPMISIWDNVDQEPMDSYVSANLDPKQIFKADEIEKIIVEKKFGFKNIDNLIKDRSTSIRLAYSLSLVVQQRLK